MNITRFTVSAAVIGLLGSSIAFAQTATPPESTTSPSSASSPSQRDATRNSASEAPATSEDAATAHQREAMAAPKTMKECMDQQAAKKDGMSKSDMTKACEAQMKMQKDRTHMSKAPANTPSTTPQNSESAPAPSPK
jgi:hypothetical protein